MKHRVFLIAALIVCSLAAGALCSSCRTGMVALIALDDNLRMAGSGFDLSGTVTDEDGNPVDGLTKVLTAMLDEAMDEMLERGGNVSWKVTR